MTAKLPFEALRTFVYAAKSGSFRSAAESLHITRGAVTQRISILETHLGDKLFSRTPHGIELLPAGDKLLNQISGSVEILEEALSSQVVNRRLRIQTVSSFANLWLIPRIGRFNQIFPDIEVVVQTTISLTNLSKGGVTADVGLRYGTGDYPALSSHKILQPSVCLIIATSLLNGVVVDSPHDLLYQFPLIRGSGDSEWDTWLQMFDVSQSQLAWGALLEDDANVLNAVLAKQGIGSVRDIYLADLISSERITVIAKNEHPEEAFYLVGNHDRLALRDARSFHRWLLEEVKKSPSQV